MILRRSALVFYLLACGTGAAWAGSPAATNPVVVELFTSQGCSDCPQADRIVTELAARKDVIALSLPITYWDMLGWKDTLATEANTQRQRAYSRAMNRSGIYTPQMIIGGVEDVVGNQRDRVMAAIASHAALAAPAHVISIAVAPSSDHVTISISGQRPKKAEAEIADTIWVMRTLSHVTVMVRGGENNNHELTYSNVVRDLRRAGIWNGQAQILTLPIALEPGRHDGIAVILQDHDYGRVIGAAFAETQKNDGTR